MSDPSRLRKVAQRRLYGYCWRCRNAYSYEDMRHDPTEADPWRFVCRLCDMVAKRPHLIGTDRARAWSTTRRHLAEVMKDAGSPT